MNATAIWNDHTFHVLLEDLVKARKSQELGPIRLQALLDYAEKYGVVTDTLLTPRSRHLVREISEAAPAAVKKRKSPARARKFPKAPAGLVLEEDESDDAPPAPSTMGYLEQQIALRRSPDESLKVSCGIVEAEIRKGKWDANGNMQILLPQGLVVSGLDAMLRSRRVPFTALSVSLPPRNTRISKSVNAMSLFDADKVSGAQGEKVAGWSVMVTK